MTHSYNYSSNRKLLSLLAHGAAMFTSFLVSILVPIVLLCTANDYVVRENARESLNFQISILMYALIAVLLKFVGIGFILMAIIGLWSFIGPIVAMVNVANSPSVPYRYPGIMRFING
jgi:uncharacterized protein